jgi:hypothetical protein
MFYDLCFMLSCHKIMPSAHTHRFHWRRYTSIVSILIIISVFTVSLSPIAVRVSHAEPPPTAAPATATPSPVAEAPQIQEASSPECEEAGNTFASPQCIIFQVIAKVLLIIAGFLGKVLIFLVDILIAFASYNSFGNTDVVTRGWVIVRDLVNMFFIVILLVSAFATIIGYDEGSFHYKRVLPKLLLMAVLINFSKTLILLAIDFSQVIMLTFVNAFQQAGPGNLVKVLQLQSVLKMAPPTGTSDTALATATTAASAGITGTVDQTNLILSIMLAIFMLSISLGIVVIMVGYLIFRIVGLWIALILSPIALFATALPSRLQRGMENFTGKYWSRLSALLTGGPVMAFFLWLTFAVVQNAGDGGLAPALDIQVTNQSFSFLSAVGNSQAIASFIVGVTLMLMGLDAAVSSASAVSETLGSFAKSTAARSKALGKLAATAPFLGAYYGGRGAARYVDRRTDISGKAATAAAGTVGQIPILRTALRKPLANIATRNRRLDLAEAKELQEGQEHMTPTQRAIMAASTPTMMATKGQKMAYAQQMMERAAPKNAQAIKDEVMPSFIGQITEMKKKELQDKAATQGLTDDAAESWVNGELGKAGGEIKNRAEQYADREVASRQSYFLDKAKHTAKRAGDEEQVRKIDEEIKKNPHLAKYKRDAAKELLADKTALNGMSTQAKGDVGVHAALLVESGAAQVDAQGNLSQIDRAKYDALEDKITDKGTLENLQMVKRFIEGEQVAGNTVNVRDMNSKMIGKDQKGSTKMFQMPVKDASKGEAAAREVERAISALPFGVGEKITGKKYTSATLMADLPNAQFAPVMSASAKQAQTQLNQAVQAAQKVPSRANQAALEAATEAAINQMGFKDAVDEGGTDAYDVARQKLNQQLVAGNFTIVSSIGKDIKKLSGAQQTQLISGAATANVIQQYINARGQGKTTKGQDKAMMTIVETAASIDGDIKRTGRAATPEEVNVQDLVRQVRSKLNSTNPQESKELPRAWKIVVEEKET